MNSIVFFAYTCTCRFANCVTMFILCVVTTHVKAVFYFDRSENSFCYPRFRQFLLSSSRHSFKRSVFVYNFVKFIITRRIFAFTRALCLVETLVLLVRIFW